MQTEDVSDSEGLQTSFASRTAVLADAQGLLTCYGVGEDGSANLPHAVVELCFTSSVRFLQPGLLLQVGIQLLGLTQGLQQTRGLHAWPFPPPPNAPSHR